MTDITMTQEEAERTGKQIEDLKLRVRELERCLWMVLGTIEDGDMTELENELLIDIVKNALGKQKKLHEYQ